MHRMNVPTGQPPEGRRGLPLWVVFTVAAVVAITTATMVDALCKTGKEPVIYRGGGACKCDITLHEGENWACMSGFYCERGDHDYLQALGGCLDPADKSTKCHEGRADWIAWSYKTDGACHVIDLGVVTGTCAQFNGLPANSTIGWNGPEACAETAPPGNGG